MKVWVAFGTFFNAPQVVGVATTQELAEKRFKVGPMADLIQIKECDLLEDTYGNTTSPGPL